MDAEKQITIDELMMRVRRDIDTMYEDGFIHYPYELKFTEHTDKMLDFEITTGEWIYMISMDEEEDYMGCILDTEDGGEDLEDGRCTVETWENILSGIRQLH